MITDVDQHRFDLPGYLNLHGIGSKSHSCEIHRSSSTCRRWSRGHANCRFRSSRLQHVQAR